MIERGRKACWLIWLWVRLAERTQEAYLRAVHQLSRFYDGRCPTRITQQQVKEYLLWMRVENGVATLKYLSRYVFRTAITNDRIVSMHNGQVTFSYRKSGEHRDRRMTLPVFEFLRRFLQHVLPRRLQKIRHYGFLSRRSNIDLNDVRAAILESLRDVEPDLELEDWRVPTLHPPGNAVSDADGPVCPNCGGRLIFERFHRIRPPPLTRRMLPPSASTLRR